MPSDVSEGIRTVRSIRNFFAEHGYYHARGVFSAGEIAALAEDFDRIVDQIAAAGEPVDATWDGGQAAAVMQAGDRILHTHNVQKFSAAGLTRFSVRPFLTSWNPSWVRTSSSTTQNCFKNRPNTDLRFPCIRTGRIFRPCRTP